MELPNKKYNTIVIDPPWEYGAWGKPSNKRFKKSANKVFALPYLSMSISEIKALPIKKLANENCELYLWVTQKYLPMSFDILNNWGFKYCQTLIWCKKPRGTGQGGVYTPTTEFLILARVGRMPKVRRIDSTWFLTKRPNNQHSKKPDFFQDMIEMVSNKPRLELFARRKRKGWDCWGNEIN